MKRLAVILFAIPLLLLSACKKTSNGVSDDARLSAILINDTLLADFHPDTLHYRHNLPRYFDFPVVSAKPFDPSASIVITNPPSVPGTVRLDVTSESKNSIKNYTVDFIDFYEWSGNPYVVPGQDVLYDLKVDRCDKLDILKYNGDNGFCFINNTNLVTSEFIIINFILPVNASDYSRIFVEVNSNGQYKNYIAVDDKFNLDNAASYYGFFYDAVIELRKEFGELDDPLTLSLGTSANTITHLRVSADK